MSKAFRKKILIAVFLTLGIFCILFIIHSIKIYYPILKSKELLKEHGWEVLVGGRSDNRLTTLSKEYLNEEITRMQIDASKKMGLNPLDYAGKAVTKYDFVLKESGIDNQLRADIWFFKNKIICAYIYHVETNLWIRYWPLDTSYEKIRSELKDLKDEFNRRIGS